MGRPEYLQDSDIVSTRFQVLMTPLSCHVLPPICVPYVCCAYLSLHLILLFTFQRRDVYGAWEQYLGLEHTDNAPKRSYAANQASAHVKLFKSIIMVFFGP